MRTDPCQLRATEPVGRLRSPAADANNSRTSSGAPTWSDSPRQLKQGALLAQMKAAAAPTTAAQGGLPHGLRSGIEAMSGFDMSGVRVHRNSSKPAALQAHAYAHGQDIHLAAGQEKHLPHEAWHVVQQAQGRVKPTLQMKSGLAVNHDTKLESEADAMGAKAAANTELGVQHSLKAIHAEPIAQLYRIGYAPNLTGLTVPGGGGGAYSQETFGRPAGWYEGTLDRLFARAVDSGRVRRMEELSITLVQCESAGSWHNINDMQIGHSQNWESYVAATVPANVREATSAYNDLNNLRLEGATPNASHDFEAGRESEEDDSDLDDDDFIDRSDGGKMDPMARKMLDEYKSSQSSYYRV